MHNAPPVAYPVGRFVWGRAMLTAVLGLSAAGLIAWQLESQSPRATVWCAWIFWAVCAVVAALLGPRQVMSEGHLLWNGETWVWRRGLGTDALVLEDQVLNLTVGMDFGANMGLLVQADPQAHQGRRPCFCAWVSERSMPSKWHGFRCAVYSRPKPHEPVDEARE